MIFIFSVGLRANWIELHGGDPVNIEFNVISEQVIHDLKEIPTLRVYADFLETSFIKLQIVPTSEKLFLNQIRKVAILYKNDEQSVLKVNSELWSQFDQQQKLTLVIHELLNNSSIHDSNYVLSSLIFNRLSIYRELVLRQNLTIDLYVNKILAECRVQDYRKIAPLVLEKRFLKKLIQNKKSDCVLYSHLEMAIQN